jgi:hypothetical protein
MNKSASKQYTESYARRHAKQISTYQKGWRGENKERNSMEAVRLYQQTGEPKKCGQCKVVKALTEFSLCRGNADGLEGWCKTCKRAAAHNRWLQKKGKK